MIVKKYLKKRMRGKEHRTLGNSTKLLASEISEHRWYEKEGIGGNFSKLVAPVNQRVRVQGMM